MKAIQVVLDEEVLAGLEADDEVRRHGRSAVFRRLAREYLRQRRRSAIARQYREAYGRSAGLGNEFAGWEDEGTWPSP